ncbi:hypothetical protein VZT92_011273 [Zoarces viviparus]|uniref:Ig-like domain-containing protein n=1 Tax=Zoarces viviparus TaxID=48416 RepID=A0AAW1FBJ2_ZOAVI
MVGFRWIQMYFLLLQITEPVAGQLVVFVTVRDGDEATLPCNSVMDDHENCDSTEWLFDDPRRTAAVLLVRDGQIHKAAKDKSDRLSVSEKCSLIIKNVTDEDVGRYTCRQLRSGRQQGPDALIYLFGVTMTEHEDDDEVTLRCSVKTYEGRCRHTVKWLLQGRDIDKDNKELNPSQSSCSASLTFLTSHFIYTSRFNSFKCEVTEGNKVQQFSFRNSPSDENTGDDTTTATHWGLYVGVALGLAALLIVVVVVVVVIVRCSKTRANRTRVDDTIVLTSNPAQSAPGERQDPADPEGVSYASISLPGTNSKARVRGSEDAVTYSTVNHPAADDNNLYATINQPKK